MMLASKTFVKKTKKGAVVKVVREHYLRDDVYCGVIGCSLCKQQERCPVVASDLCQYPHLVLPDTNIVLHQTNTTCTVETCSNHVARMLEMVGGGGGVGVGVV